MAETGASTDHMVRPIERRRHERLPLTAIAYVEIDAGNGGIVLNLSEEGLALQTVVPLDKQREIRFRIKTPRIEEIEATAQVVWLSETRRQAGVRFLDLSLGGQLRIQDWIHSQIFPRAPREGFPKRNGTTTETHLGRQTTPEHRPDKWLSLMPEFNSPVLREQESAGVADRNKNNNVLSGQEVRGTSAKFRFESRQQAEKAKELLSGLLKTVEPHSGDDQEHDVTSSLELKGGATAITSSNQSNAKNESVLASPVRLHQNVAAMATTEPPDPSPESGEPPASPIESGSCLAPGFLNAVRNAATKADGIHTRNRVAITLLVAICSVVLFCVGIWVGHIVTRRQPAQESMKQKNSTPIVEPTTNKSGASKPEQFARQTTDGRHAHRTSSRPVQKTQKFSPSPISPTVLPAGPNPPSKPPEPSFTSPPTVKQPENKPETNSAPEDSAAVTPSPRIVAGHVLKVSDRFNQCYLAYRVEPVYPPQALQAGIEGVVKIKQVIGPDGNVRSMTPLSGPPLLIPAALEAARYWRYIPALLNGQPVETEQEVAIDFRLPH